MRWKLVVCLSVVVLLSALVTGCGTGGSAPSVPIVPIEIENAEDLGGIVFRLVYDSSVLEFTGIKQGARARSRTMQFGIVKPGEIEVLVGAGTGISGDFTLAKLECKVLNSAGASKLVVQVTDARNAKTGQILNTQVSEGSFSASDMSVKAPLIVFTG